MSHFRLTWGTSNLQSEVRPPTPRPLGILYGAPEGCPKGIQRLLADPNRVRGGRGSVRCILVLRTSEGTKGAYSTVGAQSGLRLPDTSLSAQQPRTLLCVTRTLM